MNRKTLKWDNKKNIKKAAIKLGFQIYSVNSLYCVITNDSCRGNLRLKVGQEMVEVGAKYLTVGYHFFSHKSIVFAMFFAFFRFALECSVNYHDCKLLYSFCEPNNDI